MDDARLRILQAFMIQAFVVALKVQGLDGRMFSWNADPFE